MLKRRRKSALWRAYFLMEMMRLLGWIQALVGKKRLHNEYLDALKSIVYDYLPQHVLNRLQCGDSHFFSQK